MLVTAQGDEETRDSLTLVYPDKKAVQKSGGNLVCFGGEEKQNLTRDPG